jgi:hypothetical protein
MSTNDPDEIRRDIDRTRAGLSYDVNALADEASPRTIARRQAEKVRSSAGSLRDRLFGSDDDDYTSYGSSYGSTEPSGVAGAAQQAREGAGELAGNVREAAADAPQQLRRRTRGAPLALGLIAFGVGGMVAALMPASDTERRAASAVKDQAGPLVEEAKAVAQEAVENVRPAAEEAVASVKDTATAGAETVRADAKSSAETVKQDAARAKDDVARTTGS